MCPHRFSSQSRDRLACVGCLSQSHDAFTQCRGVSLREARWSEESGTAQAPITIMHGAVIQYASDAMVNTATEGSQNERDKNIDAKHDDRADM